MQAITLREQEPVRGGLVAPTPEQLADDGRADGYPVRSAADVELDRKQAAERISRLFPRGAGDGRQRRQRTAPLKRVVCLETGQEFESAEDAGAFFNIHPDAVRSGIYRERRVHGMRFDYAVGTTIRRQQHPTPVIAESETERIVYPTVYAAAEAWHVCLSTITNKAKYRASWRGFAWRYGDPMKDRATATAGPANARAGQNHPSGPSEAGERAGCG